MDDLKGNKRKIYEYIEKNPGKHMREIKRSLGLPMGDVQYNLYSLEKLGYIVSLRKGLYKRYYPRNIFNEREKGIIALISNENTRKILLMLMKKPGSTQSEIVLFTNLTPATINWHMKRLIEENVVEIKREGRNIRYYIRDVDKVENLMRLYYPAFWERWADNFAELWSELSNFKKEEKKYD
jgi:predicted transcriptional regulator